MPNELRNRCKKHPKYEAKKYPTTECKWCLYLWDFKQGADRIMDEVDRKFLEYLGRLNPLVD